MSIQLENGRINLEGLKGITDHLKALSITNKTLDEIKLSLDAAEDKTTDWYRRATSAHKAWFWMRTYYTTTILYQQQNEVDRLDIRALQPHSVKQGISLD